MTEEQKKEPKKISIDWEPLAFPIMDQGTIMPASVLSFEISKRFKQIFHDYVGCNIEFAPTKLSGGMPILDMYMLFRINTDKETGGKLRNIIDVADPKAVANEKSMFNQVRVVQNKYEGKQFILNDETKEALLPFMRQDIGPKSVNDKKWKECIVNINTPAETNVSIPSLYRKDAEISYFKVSGFNLNEIASRLFGNTMVVETTMEQGKVINKTANAKYQVSVLSIERTGDLALEIHRFDSVANEKYISSKSMGGQIPTIRYH